MSMLVREKVSREKVLEITKECELASVMKCRREPGCPVACCAYCGLYELCNDVCVAFGAKRTLRR